MTSLRFIRLRCVSTQEQGQSAADSWKEISRPAAKHRITMKVLFQWRANPKAKRPGSVSLIRAGTASQSLLYFPSGLRAGRKPRRLRMHACAQACTHAIGL